MQGTRINLQPEKHLSTFSRVGTLEMVQNPSSSRTRKLAQNVVGDCREAYLTKHKAADAALTILECNPGHNG